MSRHEITRADIMPMDEYAEIRKERTRDMREVKRNRRLAIGPHATFYFECYETMWHQIHEMLHIEKGGEEQIEDELRAYNPLIPNGKELVATLMFEIDDRLRRTAFLASLGGVEETVTLSFEGEAVVATPEADVDRTTADGKASAIQFLHFPFNDEQIAKFRRAGTKVTLSVGHEKYPHMTVMSETVREALSRDFA